jgi:hypothetical protein
MQDALERFAEANETTSLLGSNFDIAKLITRLETIGAHAVALIPDTVRETLLEAARNLHYEEQPEAVGPPKRRVQQRLASCDLHPDQAPFAGLARALEALLAGALARLPRSPWPSPPIFNDLLLQRYPPGPYALTPHLDGKRFVDLVAIAVLEGSARFCVCADRAGNKAREIHALPGSVIFMRAPGFGGAEDGRPFHCVLDVESERYTLGMRNDSRI